MSKMNEFEYAKKVKTIKFLSNACIGAGAVKVIQIGIPIMGKAIATATTGTLVISGLAVPYYFIGTLLVGLSTPTITEFIKSNNEKKKKKAEELKNDDCLKLED